MNGDLNTYYFLQAQSHTNYTNEITQVLSTTCTPPTPSPTTQPTPQPTTQPTPNPTTQPTPNPTTQPTPAPTFPSISLKIYGEGSSGALANLTCTSGNQLPFNVLGGTASLCGATVLQATVISSEISPNGFFWLADTSGTNVRLFQRNGSTDTANQAGSCELCSAYIPTPSPTTQPTPQPTTQPTPQPTTQPTPQPTTQPTFQPTTQPTPSPTAPTCFAVAVQRGRNAEVACCTPISDTVYFNASTVEAATTYYGSSTDCSTVATGAQYFNTGGVYYVWNGSSMSGPFTCPACP